MNPTLSCGSDIAGCQWRQWWCLSPLTPRLACVMVFGMKPGSGRGLLALSLGGSPGNGPPRDVSSSLPVSPSSVPGLSGMVSGKILLCTCRSCPRAYRSSILRHTLCLQWYTWAVPLCPPLMVLVREVFLAQVVVSGTPQLLTGPFLDMEDTLCGHI